MTMSVVLPKFVDAQQQVLWWEADEFVIAITIFGIGMVMHTLVYPLLTIIAVMPVVSRMKRSALEGAAMHILYSTGLIPLNKEFDDALERDLYL